MKKFNYLIALILLAGAALRFYGFPHIPFTYDELSAWGRTGYSSFGDLINQGVRGDGHPALIQVFLNYWRKIFGDSEASFKLPFLLMGMACIYLIFLIGRKWFNETTGLICAAFVCVLQYTVMYSQIARPYISGLFFSLMMVWYWTKYVFDGRGRKHLIAFAVFAVLCCYNHYFSLLFAFIVGLSGFFFLEKKKWLEYFIAGTVIVILFIPHARITSDQFKIGGVGGWLSRPDHRFFWNYVNYIFDFSWRVKEVVVVLILLSFVFIDKNWRGKNKFRLLCAVWFFTPLLIGYFYSKYRNPVLQYSVLIFSFPFLLFLIFSFFRELKPILLSGIVVLILSAGIFSLISERKHYQIFYKEPVEEMVKSSVAFAGSHPSQKTLVIINEPKKYMGYYLSKWNSRLTILSWQDLNFQSYTETRKFIAAQDPDYILCGNIPLDHLLVIRNYFPKLILAEKGFTREFFVYGKVDCAEPEINDMSFADSVNFIQPGKFWNADHQFVHADSNPYSHYYIDSAQEFSPTFFAPLDSIMKHRDDILQVDIAVENVKKNSNTSLVVSFEKDKKNLFWQEKPFSFFIDSSETSGHLVYAIRLRDFDFTSENPLLKIYLWNKNHEEFDITSMKVSIEKGNPLIYSLIEEVPLNTH